MHALPLLVLVALLGAAPAAPDRRCQGTPKAAAARFAQTALPGQTVEERYLAYVRSCALPRVTALTSKLIAFATVSSDAPADKGPELKRMKSFLTREAKAAGLAFRTVGQEEVFELTWGEGPPLLSFIF